ncbi:hypothetical protein NH340_JMT04815 [Sarcoptes scabiei]|nr:hypothetical protein NH340_JMT04815 [Sarcoptes scabiei]
MSLLPCVIIRSSLKHFNISRTFYRILLDNSSCTRSNLGRCFLRQNSKSFWVWKNIVFETNPDGLRSILFARNITRILPRSNDHQTIRLFQNGNTNRGKSSNQSIHNEWDELTKLPLTKRLHLMLKRYWYIAIPFHLVASCFWFGSLFLLCKFGLNGAIIINWIKPYIMESERCPKSIKNIFEKDADKLGHVTVALLLYKIATPARYATTVFGTIYLLRHLLRRGVLIKTAKEQLKSVRTSSFSRAVSINLKKKQDRFRKFRKRLRNRPR